MVLSLRFKLLLCFGLLVALTGVLAGYAVNSIDHASRALNEVYNAALMGVSSAKSASGKLIAARGMMDQAVAAPDGVTAQQIATLQAIITDLAEDLKVVRERVRSADVGSALEVADVARADWLQSGLLVIAPADPGVAVLPLSTTIAQKGTDASVTLDDVVDQVAAFGYQMRNDAALAVETSRRTMIIAAAGIAGVGALLAIGFSGLLVRPIRIATQVAERVASGNYSQSVGTIRRDELGRLLKSLATMQTSLTARAEQDHAALLEKDRSNAEATLRRQHLDGEILGFRAAANQLLQHMRSDAAGLAETAGGLLQVSATAGDRVSRAAELAGEARTNVRLVSGSAQDLEDAIAAITMELRQTNEVVRQAITIAQVADAKIGTLTEAASQIDQVVAFIRTIAGQTNLLALNATIEAARAGDAGRGFGVVASEVKSLALQTARATEEISSHISGVQAATREAANALQAISNVVPGIELAAQAIAKAVGRQGTAVGTIINNVRLAANATETVASDIEFASGTVQNVQTSASAVLETTQVLNTRSQGINAAVEHFLGKVAA